MSLRGKIIKKVKKIVLGIFYVILVLALGIGLFLVFWPSFGATASKADRQVYAERAKNFDGKIFLNEHEFSVMSSNPNEVSDNRISTKGIRPKDTIPLARPNILKVPAMDQVTVTWFGHSSWLLQMHGKNILIDPIFSDVTSPVRLFGLIKAIGLGRFSDLPLSVEDLPPVDILLLSHDHYDHLDYDFIRKFDKNVKQYIVPLGVENHLSRWGVDKAKITTMAWWEEINLDGLLIACTPAQHFSGRSLFDRFASLWASWVFKDESHSIYESGDSGFNTHYEEIHDKYGDFDFALMDCAQYNPRWAAVHQNPEQAFEAVKILGAKVTMPIHWGAFILSTHPWDDPAVRLTKAAEGTEVLVITPMIGETVDFDNIRDYQRRWFENVE